jgi:hypothetical protein
LINTFSGIFAIEFMLPNANDTPAGASKPALVKNAITEFSLRFLCSLRRVTLCD